MMKNADAGFRDVDKRDNLLGHVEIIPLLYILLTLVLSMVALRFDWLAMLWVPPLIWFLVIPMADRRFLAGEEPGDTNDGQHREVFWSGFLCVAALTMLSTTGSRSVSEMIALGLCSGLLVFVTLMGSSDFPLNARSRFTSLACTVLRGIAFTPHFSERSRKLRQTIAATPDDSESARMGESYYAFLRRYIPGAILCRDNLSPHSKGTGQGTSLFNELLKTFVVFVLTAGLLVHFGGWEMLLFLLTQSIVVSWQVSAFDYTKRYGLLRQRSKDGVLETYDARHSWLSASWLNTALLSGNAIRQSRNTSVKQFADDNCGLLRHPFGANLLSLIVLSPKTWFALVNEPLAEKVNNDLRKVNLDGDAYVELMEAYHRAD